MSFQQITLDLLAGFLENCKLFALTLLLALPLGLVVTLGTMCRFRPIRYLSRGFVWIIRGTPLMLQLFVVLYAPGLLFGAPVQSRMSAALIAFVVNYAAYFSEIYRGGIESIPDGQYEAAKVLGFNKKQTFFRIILPQVVKRIIPPMGNEFITLVKDTSLAQVIAVVELLKVTNNWVSSAVSMVPFVIAAVFYLVMNGVVTRCFTIAEKRLSYYR